MLKLCYRSIGVVLSIDMSVTSFQPRYIGHVQVSRYHRPSQMVGSVKKETGHHKMLSSRSQQVRGG